MGYRSKDSHLGRTPEARARQLANLRRGRSKNPVYPPAPKKENIEQSVKTLDVVTFAVDYLGLSFRERPAQEVILRAIYGLPISAEPTIDPEDVDGVYGPDPVSPLDLWRRLTGRDEYTPGNEAVEVALVLGARSGKSQAISSVVALYESICRAHVWRKELQPDEPARAIIVATKQLQAEQIIGHNCVRLLENSPKLKSFVESYTASELRLTNGMRVMWFPAIRPPAVAIPFIA